ncbi:MAG: helix-turn-helix domain-containing protein [Fibrobacterota bacterium]
MVFLILIIAALFSISYGSYDLIETSDDLEARVSEDPDGISIKSGGYLRDNIFSDKFAFYASEVSRPFSMSVRIDSARLPGEYSSCGIMHRAGAGDSAAFLNVSITARGGLTVLSREKRGGKSHEKTIGEKYFSYPDSAFDETADALICGSKRYDLPLVLEIKSYDKISEAYVIRSGGKKELLGICRMISGNEKPLAGFFVSGSGRHKAVARFKDLSIPSLEKKVSEYRKLPAGRMISPKSTSVINSDRVMLSAEVESKNIKEVRFYGSFLDSDWNKVGDHLIGKANYPPWEFVWSCASIPDQDPWYVSFHCDIEDSSGLVNSFAGGKQKFIAIDRNKSLSNREFYCYRKNPEKTRESFISGNNKVFFESRWDKDSIYIKVRIEDENVIAPPQDGNIWEGDAVCLYFDPDHDHNVLKEEKDRQFTVSVNGTFAALEQDYRNGVYRRYLNPDSLFKTIVKRNKKGYSVLFTIDREYIGENAAAGKSCGFDMMIIDVDSQNGDAAMSSWSGIESGSGNPSEWGNIVFIDDRGFFEKYFIFVFVLCAAALAGTALVLYSSIRRRMAEKPVFPERSRRIADYIRENVHDQAKMVLENIGKEFGLSSDYLSRIFKEETGYKLNEFVNSVRIEKAKELLLKNPDRKITDIAFDSGFGTLEHFVRQFRKSEGLTPSEYRRRKIV